MSIRDKKNDDILNYDSGVPLSLNIPHKPVPYFEQEWEVEITELPYELEGWSKGQDLRKWDQKVLEKKIVDYYQKLWKILNNGESHASAGNQAGSKSYVGNVMRLSH